jgi:Ca2+-binding EF-hand superfamily protein
MKTLTSLLSVLALSASISLAADEAKPEKPKVSPEEAFKKLDKDSDGKLSLDEYRGRKEASEAEAKFKELDKDGDGKLSLEEYSARAGKAPKK